MCTPACRHASVACSCLSTIGNRASTIRDCQRIQPHPAEGGASAIHVLTQQVQATSTQNVANFESMSKQTADHQENQEISNQVSENLRQDILAVEENVGNENSWDAEEISVNFSNSWFVGGCSTRTFDWILRKPDEILTSMTASLQSQIPTRDCKDSCSSSWFQREGCEARNTKDSARTDDTTDAGHCLRLSLSRLCKIAKDTRTVAPSQEARLVLEALETYHIMQLSYSVRRSLSLWKLAICLIWSLCYKERLLLQTATHGDDHFWV